KPRGSGEGKYQSREDRDQGGAPDLYSSRSRVRMRLPGKEQRGESFGLRHAGAGSWIVSVGEEASMKPLRGKVAVIAGATRGAGRGIACMLGEAGATVYGTGRSICGKPAEGNYGLRPETIEETAEMVTARGGAGIPVQVDHNREDQVQALFARVQSEQQRLDILVNDFWGGVQVTEFGKPFWEVSLERGRRMMEHIHSHLLTSCRAVPLMIERGQGLVVEIIDGDNFGYRGHLFYDLVLTAVMRFTYAMARDLRPHNVTALALTPGYLRSEATLEAFGV